MSDMRFYYFLVAIVALAGFPDWGCRPSAENSSAPSIPPTERLLPDASHILATARRLLGAPYLSGGDRPSGFDCSGFVYYVFRENGIALPHSSAELAKTGKAIARCDAAPGDIILFTGTDSRDRHPGHAGIIVENAACMLTFIHSSSAATQSGVKYSTLTGSYQDRFLEIRRIL